MLSQPTLERFAADYTLHRAREGRAYCERELLDLPYLESGAFADQWAIRSRTFDAFMRRILRPMARIAGPLTVLDLGAGNGWLSHRVALDGHRAIALDIRGDATDGLGAAAPFHRRVPGKIVPIVASFDSIPLDPASVDIALFNASLHYATDLGGAVAEARRIVRPGGKLAILDSPFYRSEEQGEAMVAEKAAAAAGEYGGLADRLTALPFIDFLTRGRLDQACPDLRWKRLRVTYPLGYELRPLRAALAGRRAPSRFDLWVADRP